MEWYYILIIIVAILTILFIASISIYLTYTTTHPHHSSRSETIELWKKYRFVSSYDRTIRKDITFKMRDGYIIHGDYILNDNSKKFVICVHGFSTNREAEIEYGLLFLRLGYNVIVYDQRGHGDNANSPTRMGTVEADDLDQIISQVRDIFGKDIIIGLHGLSMGGATVLLVTKYRQDFEFIVDDCGFTKLSTVIRYQIRRRHLPGFIFTPFVSLLCKIFYGFTLREASIEKDIKKIKVPILIFHGSKDTFVPIINSHILNDNLTSYHKMVIYNSKHADCLSDQREEYEKELEEFINKVNNK